MGLVQYSKGGPIIAVQVENEYGADAADQEYMPFVKEVGELIHLLLHSSYICSYCIRFFF